MSGYNTDYVAWAEKTAQLLTERRFSEIEMDALIDEVQSLARSDRRAVRSHLEVLFFHLLKLAFASSHDIDRAGAGWRRSVRQSRAEILDLIDESPSLADYPLEVLARVFSQARASALDELALEDDDITTDCPWSISEVLAEDFFGGAL